jgi:hypothetical protein
MTTNEKVVRRKRSLLELTTAARQCQQSLPGDGLFAPAVLRDPPQLPDLRR